MRTDKLIMIYYLVINLTAFALYGTDKKKAQEQHWRIPEKTLFLTAFLGGATGALCGMQIFHHKTRKNHFWILNILALVLHVVLLYLMFFHAPAQSS